MKLFDVPDECKEPHVKYCEDAFDEGLIDPKWKKLLERGNVMMPILIILSITRDMQKWGFKNF